MNILYTQNVYPIFKCICGIGVIYLYSCSQNNIDKLKNTISSLTKEVLYVNKQIDTNEKRYIKSLGELEQLYETKIKNLKSKVGIIGKQEDTTFINFIKQIINNNSLSLEDKINECKTQIDLKEYIIE